MKRAKCFLAVLVLALVGVCGAQNGHVLLSEDFEGLVLGPNVDEGTPGEAVWTDIPPEGWINDASGVPGIEDPSTDGVTEWAGWGFANKDWWIQTAGDQRRSEFTLGQGTVAIADPDEWDDAGHPKDYPANTYDVWLSTAPIDLSTSKPGTVQLTFDSSWRPEFDDDYHQTGTLRVSFDGGEPVELLLWESDSASANYKYAATNETIVVDIDNPAGAMSMVLTWGLYDAGNDWWWAIDNIVVTAERSARLAYNPEPAHGAVEVPVKTTMSWTPGEYVQGLSPQHQVILSDDLGAVESAASVVSTQDANSFDATGHLDFSTTYYWRVDEVNAAPDHTIYKGEIWSFTVEPFAYPVTEIITTSSGLSDEEAGPQNTINGSGLNANDQHSTMPADMWLAAPGTDPLYLQYEFDRVYKLHRMWVWNYNVQFELMLGFGLKNVTIEYSENGVDWTVLGDVEFAQATAKSTYTPNTTVDFGGIPARYVRLNVNSGWGMMDQFGLSEVRFLYIPAQAREPEPADGASDVDPATALSWRAGREADVHEIYLGTDANDLTPAGTESEARFVPDDLAFGGTYYWQVVEVNEADEVSAWASEVWSFSTTEYVLIDGFETYDDDLDAGTTIFDTWLDGWVNETGSTVGYFEAPFAEKTIVRSGSQSMPLQYDNSVAPFYSEAERNFDSPQDWTGHGADTLVLYVRGNGPDFVETTDGEIVMSAIGTDIWDTADQFRYAYKNLAGDGSIVVRVDSLINSNEWAKAGVMIRETLEPGSQHAFVAMTPTPSHGISFQRRPVAGQASANTDVADIEIPHWVKLTRTGNLFTAQQSVDGVTWVDITPTAPVEIQMASSVYIGLALTSHSATVPTTAEFSNVSMTGAVSGEWQTGDIGTAQPMGNSSEAMYVTIEDSAGKSATVTNADEAITVRPSWQSWLIPYSDLSGVNLGRVERMIIGVGSATSPTAGGTGTVYIDDVVYGHPAGE